MGPTYQYAARIDRCIDGDSLAVTLDLGFSVTISQQLRLLGVDCAEKRGYREMPDLKKLGQLATKFVRDTVKEKGRTASSSATKTERVNLVGCSQRCGGPICKSVSMTC